MKFNRFSGLICIALAFVVFNSCQNNQPIKELNRLNGYWQISKVEKASGQEVNYSLNEVVDYITLKDSSGLRAKVKPQLNGRYISTNEAEKFVIQTKDNQTVLTYTTKYDSWNEVLLDLNPDSFTVKNDDGMVYTYNRFKGYLNNE